MRQLRRGSSAPRIRTDSGGAGPVRSSRNWLGWSNIAGLRLAAATTASTGVTGCDPGAGDPCGRWSRCGPWTWTGPIEPKQFDDSAGSGGVDQVDEAADMSDGAEQGISAPKQVRGGFVPGDGDEDGGGHDFHQRESWSSRR